MHLLFEIESSFSLIERHFTKKEMQEFAACDYAKLHLYHFGLGTWIRGAILSQNDELRGLFRQAGILREDDMSALMITLFYIQVQTKRGKHGSL